MALFVQGEHQNEREHVTEAAGSLVRARSGSGHFCGSQRGVELPARLFAQVSSKTGLGHLAVNNMPSLRCTLEVHLTEIE
jgi:hypothetical protein